MSQLYEITGCISLIKPVQTFKSGFEKQEIVVNDKDPKFPQEIAISFMRDGVKKLSEFKAGDHVTITFAIQGREWNERNFVDLKGLRIEKAVKLGGESHVGQHATASDVQSRWSPATASAQPPAPQQPQQQYDELPF
jgi:hypothetical protein